MTKNFKFQITIVALIFGLTMLYLSNPYSKLKTHNLYCTFSLKEGERLVPSHLITGYSSEDGWLFTNGSAKSCQLRSKEVTK